MNSEQSPVTTLPSGFGPKPDGNPPTPQGLGKYLQQKTQAHEQSGALALVSYQQAAFWAGTQLQHSPLAALSATAAMQQCLGMPALLLPR
jgi:hypothetical protein